MAQFNYHARTQDGKEAKGTLRAPNEQRARALLQANGLTPIDLTAGGGRFAALNQDIFSRVNTKDKVLFSRQLASMIKAGVPILESVQALIKQIDKTAFRKMLQDIAFDIEGGSSLSNSLARHPEIFNSFFIGVVKTGEASGRLSESLETLAEHLEQNYVFIRKVRSAMLYPTFVLTGVIIVIILMFVYIVPQLVALFEEASVQLPLATRVLISVTNILQNYWYIIVAVIIALILLFRSYVRTPEGQYAVSSWALRIPIIRIISQKVYLAQLSSILHTLFKSDVPVIESLTIAESSIGNAVYEKTLNRTVNAVKDGASVSEVWEHETYIAPMLTTMVAVGERSGELERSFQEAHRFFKRDVDEILETISVFLEPILVIILGIAVAIVVAGVLLPIYNLVLVL